MQMKKSLQSEKSSTILIALTSLLTLSSILLSSLPSQSWLPADYPSRMAREHAADNPSPAAIALQSPQGSVISNSISYATVNGEKINGFLSQPEAEAAKLPGVIVIHEWWGLNENIRSMTRQLAGLGYIALAVDLYGGSVAKKPNEAVELMRSVQGDEKRGQDNIRKAYNFLAEELGCPRVGVIGWCFGGGWSLQTALILPGKIDAAVIYYGRLVTDPAMLKLLSMPILGIFGAEDRGIPVEMVREFESALASLGKPAAIHIYDGANHAFANPSGRNYNAEAAEDAWQKTVQFFKMNLKAERK